MLSIMFTACRHSVPARCDSVAFSIGASHMTNTLPTPFVVRELRGRFVPKFADAAGAWIPEHGLLFQVNGPNGTTIHVSVANDGRFYVSHLAPGRYCFRTSSDWFQGYEGVVVIDPRAAQGEMTIRVAMGV